jgi:hypothetical protein
MADCEEIKSDCDEGGGEAETPVVDQIKKAATNPWTALVIALLVGGGAGGASGLLGHQNDDDTEERCRSMVQGLSQSQEKAWELHRRDDETRWASKTEVAVLGEKIDALRETVGEMRDEMRSNRRPLRRQPSGD